MSHRPHHTLFFLGAVFALMGIVSFVFPKEGLSLGSGMAINFPSLQSLFGENEKTKKADISKIIALADAEDKMSDSLMAVNNTKTNLPEKTDSIKSFAKKGPVPNDTPYGNDSTVRLNTSIQYKNASKTAMINFFNSLNNIAGESKSIRVLHYGDSQIEGDRISDYLRMKLQNQFGGEGPGLISLIPIAPSVINRITCSSGWDRYGVFAFKDKRVPHNNFGAMAQLCRYCSYKQVGDSASNTKQAWVKIQTTKSGGPKAAAYNKLKMFYGGAKTKVLCEFYDGGVFKASDSLNVGGNFNIKEYAVTPGSLNHEFQFSGVDSPDFYGVSLEGNRGVMVDNVGLRGSSGTFFNQINYGQLKQFYDHLNVRLVILQFGGNTLPYLKDKAMADNFGGYLKAQIATIKKIAPNASILVIGPADMSVKEGTEYVTHPLLEDLRDAIRKAAFDMDCAFFDMYDCMGGRNSMVSWVEAGIAAKDYIHFSPGGARKIATLLYSSLINDYNTFVRSAQ